MYDVGIIGFVFKGNYDATTTYEFLNVVHYNGSAYVAKKETTGNEPNENNEYWHIFAGAPETAVLGVKGNAEADYRTGNVNLTPENIGALPSTGGTITGNLSVSGDVQVNGTSVKEVFQSVSDGKALVASAITDKGVSTAGNATFQTMADNIGAIETGHDPVPWSNTSNGSYKFVQYGHTWISNNNGVNSSTATSSWTVTLDESTSYTFNYGVNSESSYDKLTITVNGTTVVSTASGSRKDTITVGLNIGTNTIVATYTKDGSNSSQNDCGYIVLSDVYGTTIKTGFKVASTPGSSSQIIKPDSGYDGMASVFVPAASSSGSSGTATTSDVRNGKTFSSSAGTGLTGNMPETTGNTKAGGYYLDGSSTRYINLYIPSNGYYTTDASLYMALSSCGLTEGSGGGGSGGGLSTSATAGSNIYSAGMSLSAGNWYFIYSLIQNPGSRSEITFNYGSSSNVKEIFNVQLKPGAASSIYVTMKCALVYVTASTTLTISSTGSAAALKRCLLLS